MVVTIEFPEGLFTFWKLVDSKTGLASIVRVHQDSTLEDRIARLKTDKSSADTEHAIMADTHDQRLEATEGETELWIQTHPTDVPVGQPPPRLGVESMGDGSTVVLAMFANGRISVLDAAAKAWRSVAPAKLPE